MAKILHKLKIGLIYLWAILLVLLVPVFFFSMNSPMVEKIARKIPIREGTFGEDGSLKINESKNR